MAGKEFIPFPLICPSNLDGCYSQGAYNPGGHVSGFYFWSWEIECLLILMSAIISWRSGPTSFRPLLECGDHQRIVSMISCGAVSVKDEASV
jgi:hypothetical protein